MASLLDARVLRRPGTWAASVATIVLLASVVLAVASTLSEADGHADIRQGGLQSSPLPVAADWAVGWNRVAFIHDNVWTANGRQHVVWVDPEGSPHVGTRDLPAGAWRTFDLSQIPGNPLGTPTAEDFHNVYAVSVDRDGFVHVSGNMHGNRLRYVRSRHPGAIDDWLAPAMVGTDEESVSYPTFVRRGDGGLLFFYRAGGAGAGAVVVNALEPGASSWRRLSTVLDGRADGDSPYLQHVAVNPRDGGIELVYLWRRESGPETNDDVSYLRSPDGGETWRNVSGEHVPLPVNRGSSDIAHKAAPGSVLLNSGGFTVDGAGRPHAAFLVRPTEGRTGGNTVRHLWREDNRWRVQNIDSLDGLSGRAALVPLPDDEVGMLWVGRRGRQRSDMSLVRLGEPGGRRRNVLLLTAPVGRWEVTYDTTGLQSGSLHLLAPLEAAGGTAVTAGVVTFDLAGLGVAAAGQGKG